MNRIKSLFLIMIFVFVKNELIAQDNICDCCSYSSLQYQQDYDEIFIPSIIVSEGIKEVMVYTKPMTSTDSIQLNKYPEIKFKFNKDGLVISKMYYNRIGKPHSVYELKRNRYGEISQQIFNYVDSLEQKNTFFGEEIIDFKYDTRKRLLKIKERDSKGKIVDDNKSMFTKFTYDNKNRIKKVENHRNYEDQSSVSVTNYAFIEDSLYSTFETYRKGKLSASGEKKYNKNWKEIYWRIYNEDLKSMAFELYFEYDNNDRLIKFQSISGTGSSDECPENNTFIDTYKYDNKGFITSINHTFNENTCEMTFQYRK